MNLKQKNTIIDFNSNQIKYQFSCSCFQTRISNCMHARDENIDYEIQTVELLSNTKKLAIKTME